VPIIVVLTKFDLLIHEEDAITGTDLHATDDTRRSRAIVSAREALLQTCAEFPELQGVLSIVTGPVVKAYRIPCGTR
jgi:hypothetical protein